jgi:hypothetical protein
MIILCNIKGNLPNWRLQHAPKEKDDLNGRWGQLMLVFFWDQIHLHNTNYVSSHGILVRCSSLSERFSTSVPSADQCSLGIQPFLGFRTDCNVPALRLKTEKYYFWDVTLCSLVEVRQSFGGAYCLHLQGRGLNQTSSKKQHSDKMETIYFWNFCKFQLDYTESFLRK